MSDPATHVATFRDGSQVLVTIWPDGDMEVATRQHAGATWSAPAVEVVAS